MEPLPYIDEHVISVDADRDDTWTGLLRVMCRDEHHPTAPTGFAIEHATAPERLALKGRHPFSVYRLVFELADSGDQHTRLTAQTWAKFPGPHGRIYRALVIGTGGHRIVVRLMLKRIAAQARPQRTAAR